MKKQIPVILLAVACTGLAGSLYFAHQQIARLKLELSAVKPRPAQQDPKPVVPEETATGEAAAPAEQKITGTLSESVAETAVEAAAEKTPESRDRRMMKNIAKMLENPTMNKMMEASQRGALSSMYANLMDQFNLTADEKEYFMDLLMFRQMSQVDVAMKMMAGTLSDEEKAELQAQIKDATELVQTEMKNFLNNGTDFEDFKFFEKTTAERMMLSQAESSLADTDQALSDETYQDLIKMMAEQKENFTFSSNLQDQNNTDLNPETFSSQNLEAFKHDQEELNRQILANAESMLTEEQLAAVEEALTSFSEMQATQLEMAAQMFGGGE